jgi:endonuclease-3
MENQDNQVQQLHELIKFIKNISESDKFPIIDENQNPKLFRFQYLVALILGAASRNSQTIKAIKMLQTLKGGLTPCSILQTGPNLLSSMIKGIRNSDKKIDYLIKLAGISLRDYDGDIPSTLEDLKKIDGVGLKIATLIMKNCWRQSEGIGVDTHVHRISNLLGWVNTNTLDKSEVES